MNLLFKRTFLVLSIITLIQIIFFCLYVFFNADIVIRSLNYIANQGVYLREIGWVKETLDKGGAFNLISPTILLVTTWSCLIGIAILVNMLVNNNFKLSSIVSLNYFLRYQKATTVTHPKKISFK